MTVNDSRSSTPDGARRARAALPLAMVSFTAPYVAMFTTIQWFQPAGNDGWADLAYFAGLLVLGVTLVVVVIPLVVLTLGRQLDAATRAWGTARAVMAFGGAGLVLGLVLAALVSWVMTVSPLAAIANVAVPATVGGLATRLLLSPALEHRWVAVLSWVLAALPVAGAVALVFSLGLA